MHLILTGHYCWYKSWCLAKTSWSLSDFGHGESEVLAGSLKVGRSQPEPKGCSKRTTSNRYDPLYEHSRHMDTIIRNRVEHHARDAVQLM